MITWPCSHCGKLQQAPEPREVTCPGCGCVSRPPLTAIQSNDHASVPLAIPLGPTVRISDSAVDRPAPSPSAVPGYEILSELGRGGMGVVYKARNIALKRMVALKMVLAGSYASERELTRFRAEAEAVARLQHPNIVQIYEVGEHEGRPFFALELLEGGSLSQKLKGTPMPPREAAALIEVLAHAVQAAHDKGIVHRDLKPANILMTTTEDTEGTEKRQKPEKFGLSSVSSVSSVVKITDFGLVKFLDGSGGTETGAVMGTPSYMAPEQALGRVHEIGPAVDVYALGAILYELLTGRPPFAADGLETLLRIASEEPVPPSRLNSRVPRDLETICLKCLEKDKRRRYSRAAALAEDLHRFGTGEVIQARPASALERAARWARRRPALAGLIVASTIAAFALVGVIVGRFYNAQLQEQRDLALAARADAEREERNAQQAQRTAEGQRRIAEDANRRNASLLYFNRVNRAYTAWRSNDVFQARQALQECPPSLRRWEWHYVHRLCHGDERTFTGHTGAVMSIAYRPDGARVVSGGTDGSVRVWDVAAGKTLRTLRGHTAPVLHAVYRPDGKRIASAARDNTVKIWNADTGDEILTYKGHTVPVYRLSWSPDGKRLASSAAERTVHVWNADSGEDLFALSDHSYHVLDVVFSGDGRHLATASGTLVKLWDGQTGQEMQLLRGHTRTVGGLAFSHDNKRLASGDLGGFYKVWDVATGHLLVNTGGHAHGVNGVAFSPDDRRLATSSDDRTARLWNPESGENVTVFRGHDDAVNGVAYAPNGKHLASASADGTVKIWDVRGTLETLGSTQPVSIQAMAISADGKRIAVAGRRVFAEGPPSKAPGMILIHEGEIELTALGIPVVSDDIRGVAFSPDGRRVASTNNNGTVQVWDTKSAASLMTLPAQGRRAPVLSVAYSPDGRRVASGHDDGSVIVWDAQTGKETLSLKEEGPPVFCIAFSPDGRLLVHGSDAAIKVRDARTGQVLRVLAGHERLVTALAFDKLGRLASASADRTLRIWDVTGRPETLVLVGHTNVVFSVAFSPDGKRLVSGSGDRTVKVWDTETGELALSLGGPATDVRGVIFTADGRRIIAGDALRIAWTWEAPAGS